MPPTPPPGRGPAQPIGNGGVPFGGVLLMGLLQLDRGRPLLSAALTPPAASRRSTASLACLPTSQYRVGIGVPSSSTGRSELRPGPLLVAKHDLERAREARGPTKP